MFCLAAGSLRAQTAPGESPSKWETLPIAAYDTDTGLGLGVKSFLLNHMKHRESVDVILYASTKGERWVRLVVSHPDFGLRQGTGYPLSLDLKVEYDRMIHGNFYGLGNRSRASDRETFNKEPLVLEGTAGHAFSRRMVCKSGLRYKYIMNSQMPEGGRLEALGSPSNRKAEFLSAFCSLQYDSRDSYLKPTCGWVLEGEGEWAPGSAWGDAAFHKGELTARRFLPLRFIRSVAAFRLRWQGLDRYDLPVQALLSLGGGNTLRGYPQDRFLGSAEAMANVELRFPLIGGLGGVAGYDTGKVWDRPSRADLKDWPSNPVIGLRYHMHTFIVRADLGMSRESTGFFLNFDQIL